MMKTNLLVALKNIANKPITNLVSHYSSSNRMNSRGEALELYVKDIFCNALDFEMNEKLASFADHFSYLGNQNNPPDISIASVKIPSPNNPAQLLEAKLISFQATQ